MIKYFVLYEDLIPGCRIPTYAEYNHLDEALLFIRGCSTSIPNEQNFERILKVEVIEDIPVPNYSKLAERYERFCRYVRTEAERKEYLRQKRVIELGEKALREEEEKNER